MSATSVMGAVDTSKYEIIPIGITKDGRWYLYDGPVEKIVTGEWEDYPNFIDCTIEKGKEGYGVNFAGKLIPLPQGKFPDKLMAEYAGKTVVLGVRPEDFHTESAFLEMSEDSTVEAEVEIAEMMGAEIYIHAVCGGQKLIVRAPSRVQAESGDHISLAIDKNKIHLFDKETEQAINIK